MSDLNEKIGRLAICITAARGLPGLDDEKIDGWFEAVKTVFAVLPRMVTLCRELRSLEAHLRETERTELAETVHRLLDSVLAPVVVPPPQAP